MSKVVIFGIGKIADEAYYYLTNDSDHEIVAFTVDADHMTGRDKLGLPLVPFEEIADHYPPEEFSMFVAIGYQDLNKLRTAKYDACKAKGYKLISYVCSQASNFGNVEIGDNCFILEHAVVQPCSSIGNNVFIWSGNHVGHHSIVQDHCYLCGHVIIGGSTVVQSSCFLGMNATVGHEITVGEESLIGAGALVTKDVPARSVYIQHDTHQFKLPADKFLQMTKMK